MFGVVWWVVLCAAGGLGLVDLWVLSDLGFGVCGYVDVVLMRFSVVVWIWLFVVSDYLILLVCCGMIVCFVVICGVLAAVAGDYLCRLWVLWFLFWVVL